MAANLEKSKLPLKEVLKPTGFRAPANVKDLTYEEAIASDNPNLEDNKNATITSASAEITPSSGKDAMKKVTASVALETVEKTINVTEYTEPITITPTSGKAGIGSITITLTGL